MAKAHDNAYFTPDLFEFLRQLRRHNSREWFARNKARYQQFVVEPALAFINGFAPFLAELSSHFVADPHPTRGSLFRIYRDIRFSPDQRPFKTHAGIRFAHSGSKDAWACLLPASGTCPLFCRGGGLASR